MQKKLAVIFFLSLVASGVLFAIEAANALESSSGSEKTVALKEVHRLEVDGYINAVAWNADGSRLAALSNFGSTVTLWETAHWTVLHEFKRYSGGYSFNSLAFLPDGSLITSAPNGDYSKDPR